MSNDSFVFQMHPCPNCNAPVANVARICQNCEAEQPASYGEAYRNLLAAQRDADSAAPDPVPEESVPVLEPPRSPFRKLALRLRQQHQ